MSDPTDQLHDLETLVAPAVLTPDFDTVLRVARRRRAVRTNLAVAATVTAVAVAVSVPVAAGLRTPHRTKPAGPAAVVPVYPGEAFFTVMFATRSTGYRYSVGCPPDQPTKCRLRLEFTADAGRSWRLRPALVGLTPPQSRPPLNPLVRVLGPHSLLVEADTGRRVLSTDGGVHWRAAPTRPTGPVGAATAVDRVVARCAPTGCSRNEVLVIHPDTGAESPLRNQPALSYTSFSPVRGADGSIWIAGLDAEHRPAVSASHDGGRTWTTRPLPGLSPPNGVPSALVTLDGRTAYAVTVAANTDTLGIFRTADGGATWSSLPRATGALDPAAPQEFPGIAGLPGGRILVGLLDGPVVSSDGVSFARVPGVPYLSEFQPLAGGVLARAGQPTRAERPQMYLTTDGTRWRTLEWAG